MMAGAGDCARRGARGGEPGGGGCLRICIESYVCDCLPISCSCPCRSSMEREAAPKGRGGRGDRGLAGAGGVVGIGGGKENSRFRVQHTYTHTYISISGSRQNGRREQTRREWAKRRWNSRGRGKEGGRERVESRESGGKRVSEWTGGESESESESEGYLEREGRSEREKGS